MLPLTLIAGIYGMNFEEIPGTRFPNGFWILCRGMTCISVFMVWLFRHLGWIGDK